MIIGYSFLQKGGLPFILALLLFQVVQAQQKEPAAMQNNAGFCGSQMNEADWKVYRELAKAHKEQLAARQERSPSTLYAPVIFHIVHNSQGAGVTIDEVGQALAWANEKFAPANIQFFQCAPPNVIVSNTWFNTTFQFGWDNECDAGTPEYLFDALFRVDDVINIYCVNTNGWSWSAGPSAIASRCMDWVVFHQGHINSQWLLAHELGHYFSLPHTFEGMDENVTRNPESSCNNCETAGDGFCDTPADYHNNDSLGWNSECIPDIAFDDCGNLLQPDGLNLMSYSNSACPAEDKYFSPEQCSRMYFVLIFPFGRSYLDCNSDCEDNLDLSGNHMSSQTYRTTGHIESTAVVDNEAFIIYQAESYVDLNEGFNTQNGAVFIARIANCVDNDLNLSSQLTEERSSKPTSVNSESSTLSIFPNPFSTSTTLSYSITEPTEVDLQIFNATGTLIANPVQQQWQESGNYQHTFEAKDLPNGIYWVVLQKNGERMAKRVVLTR